MNKPKKIKTIKFKKLKLQLDAIIETSNDKSLEIKALLGATQKRLNHLFKANHSMQELLQLRTRMIDIFIAKIWDYYLNDEKDIALIAVGGYGRKELLPNSDIDILMLYLNKLSPKIHSRLNEFFTTLWDIGLNPSHSTRTISDTLSFAKEELSVYTNLLECRLLTGDKNIYKMFKTEFTKNARYSDQHFFTAKIKERNQRHRQFNETAHLLEPDLKNSPGTLRDIHLLKWLCLQFFKTSDLDCLVSEKIIIKKDVEVLLRCERFLLKLRYALHLSNNRDDNRLFFDKQSDLSRYFQYVDTPLQLGIEAFMKEFYLKIKEIRALSEIILQYFFEKLVMKKFCKSSLNQYFEIREQFIHLKNNIALSKNPTLIMEAFYLLSIEDTCIGFTFKTFKKIRRNLHLINDEFRHNPIVKNHFINIFKQGLSIPLVLRLMNRHKVLGYYLPIFKYIEGQTQHDLFHLYTVDRHTIFILQQIDELKAKDIFYRTLFLKLPKPSILYVAAFFHDIGKGRRTDHSKYGAKAALEFAVEHQFLKKDAKLIAWLVRSHLLMSETSQKKDLNDQKEIQKFLSKVKTVERLNYLLLLTIADIRATNKNLWNSWREALLKQLYKQTKQQLIKHNQSVTKEEFVLQKKESILTKLGHDGVDLEKAIKLWEKIGTEYFLKEHENRILWHTKLLLDFDISENQILISIENHKHCGATEVFVCTKDRPDLFANTVLGLDKANVNILDARIITADNHFCLNTYAILNYQNKLITSSAQIKRINNRIKQYVIDNKSPKRTTKRYLSRQLAYFCQESKISFQNQKGKPFTKLIIQASDRPGILAQIGLAFKNQKIKVHRAKIVTLGDQVEDVFYISDPTNAPLKDKKLQISLRKQIEKEIET